MSMKPTEDKSKKHHWLLQKEKLENIGDHFFCDQKIFNQEYFVLCVGKSIYCRSHKCKKLCMVFFLCRFYAGLLLDLLYVVHVLFFPTCQVRVVRFYQSCSSSPPPPRSLPPLPSSLPPCQLFAKLFANFRTQWPLLDLNCKGLSALGTAGPQPGTFRAQ